MALAGDRANAWPPHAAGIQADADVLYGVLSNGLRYAVLRNTNPRGAATFTLRIGAGSLNEAPSERGLAHFLEHMSYNGSHHFAPGTTTQALHRAGLRHRALTDFDNTTYSLASLAVEPVAIETGFRFLQDVAYGLALSQEAIDREKETVLSELRLRDTATNQANDLLWRALQQGTLAADRIQGGDEAVVRAARREQLLEFYARHYRPERALFVAVGDFEPKHIEARIADAFRHWPQLESRDAEPSLGGLPPAGNSIGTFVHPGVPNRLTIARLHPVGLASDGADQRKQTIARRIALSAINRRLARLANDSKSAVLQASVSFRESPYALGTATLTVTPRNSHFRTAAESALRELERALRYPLLQSEVDREVKQFRDWYRNAAISAASRVTNDIAADAVERLSRGYVLTTPAFDFELFEGAVAMATGDAMSRAASSLFSGSHHVTFASSQRPLEPNGAILSSLWQAIKAESIAAPSELPSKAFAFRPGPGRPTIVNRVQVAAVGATQVSYANGIALTIKPTTFAKGRVEVNVRFGKGRRLLPSRRPGLARAIEEGFVSGGLRSLRIDELAEALAGRSVHYALSVVDDAYVLSGHTTDRDLELQLQLLAAFLQAPGFNPDALTRAQEWFKLRQNDITSQPVELLESRLPAFVRSGDDRWETPSPAVYSALKIGDLQRALRHPLTRGPVEITIVGDVDIEKAISAVNATFATLPKRNSVRYPVNDPHGPVSYPAKATTQCWHHTGRADQALAGVIWPGPSMFPHPRLARTAQLIGASFKRAMFDEIVKEGLSYRLIGTDHQSTAFRGFGFLPTVVEVRPEQVDRVLAIMEAFVARWRSGLVDRDLLNRVRKSFVDSRRAARETNSFWSSALGRAHSMPETLDAIASELTDFESISEGEIASAASVYFDPSRRIELRVLPKGCANDSH